MNRFILTATCGLFLAASLSVPALGDTPMQKGFPNPGTINYVEGQASIGNQQLGDHAAGEAVLHADQTLTTNNGKVEVLLTPGVFARVGDNSALKMVSPDLTRTELNVEQGEAMVEVTEIFPQNNLLIDQNGATIKIQKTGLYDFDADQRQFRVFDGQATVQDGDRQTKVKGGHQLSLEATNLKTQKFDKNKFQKEDALYQWSSLRSAYLAEANVNQAPIYVNAGYGFAPGWAGAAWYWDPWFNCYTFIPGDGIFYSPFGWGFYPPYLAYQAPIYVGGVGHIPHHFGPSASQWGPGRHYIPAKRGGGFENGFHATNGTHGVVPQSPRMSVPQTGLPGAPQVRTPGAMNRTSPGGFRDAAPSGGGFRGAGGSHGAGGVRGGGRR